MNVDPQTVAGFGDEWGRFDQRDLPADELRSAFEQYFSLFPWSRIGHDAVGFDAGCGSGRWATLVAPRVRKLHCVDASSQALAVAQRNLGVHPNVELTLATLDDMPFPDESMDFGYSLGVLHHIPDSLAALRSCVRKLKPSAPFLVYLYYAFDNRPRWFRAVWKASDAVRRVVSRLPNGMRYGASQAIAASVYFPLARAAGAFESLGVDVTHFPLAAYRHSSFYTMRTDSLDRFGTRLEQRFTRSEIAEMMRMAGLTNVRFRDAAPFWTAIGTRA